ncbi:hypothetical protein G6F65_019420 [Rhizopus arrhizus]|nr:hypothetical protein G6F65_019420 [Rhizopus arrhizus]
MDAHADRSRLHPARAVAAPPAAGIPDLGYAHAHAGHAGGGAAPHVRHCAGRGARALRRAGRRLLHQRHSHDRGEEAGLILSRSSGVWRLPARPARRPRPGCARTAPPAPRPARNAGPGPDPRTPAPGSSTTRPRPTSPPAPLPIVAPPVPPTRTAAPGGPPWGPGSRSGVRPDPRPARNATTPPRPAPGRVWADPPSAARARCPRGAAAASASRPSQSAGSGA